MTSQIFKKPIPTHTFINILKLNCEKKENCYTFNNVSYKKGVYNNSLVSFINEIKQYYHTSKQTYLTKKLSYNMFTTILRQVCNFHRIPFTSQIKYDKSNYEICYYIFVDE